VRKKDLFYNFQPQLSPFIYPKKRKKLSKKSGFLGALTFFEFNIFDDKFIPR